NFPPGVTAPRKKAIAFNSTVSHCELFTEAARRRGELMKPPNYPRLPLYSAEELLNINRVFNQNT
ncbi:hypothetical protein J6590_081379, partial [Homalodisca vitripennis]